MVTSVLKELPASIFMPNPDDGGSRLLWNIHNQLSDYMASHPEDSTLSIHCHLKSYSILLALSILGN
jgi:hypothetical protein